MARKVHNEILTKKEYKKKLPNSVSTFAAKLRGNDK